MLRITKYIQLDIDTCKIQASCHRVHGLHKLQSHVHTRLYRYHTFYPSIPRNTCTHQLTCYTDKVHYWHYNCWCCLWCNCRQYSLVHIFLHHKDLNKITQN